jgi:hypothetical protein
MSDDAELVVTFGEGGTARQSPGFGWASPEAGHTWTDGPESGLLLPAPSATGSYVVTLRVSPFLFGDAVTGQRLTVMANGGEVGDFLVREQSSVECVVPLSLIRKRPDWLAFTFQHPDAVRPADISDIPDRRQLALSFEAIRLRCRAEPGDVASGEAGTAAATEAAAGAGLLEAFENLGATPEFGLVQRHCGVERPGLLRFAEAPLPALVGALQARFDGLGNPDQIELLLNHRQEYLVVDRRYGFVFRPGLRLDDGEPHTLRQEQAALLGFLRQQLIADLAAGGRIFVYRGMRRLPRLLIARLAEGLRACGTSTLLCVDLPDADHPPGTVEVLGDGVVKGYVERFVPGGGGDASLGAWLAVCRQADELHRGPERKAADRISRNREA